jgi:hypothetical protein
LLKALAFLVTAAAANPVVQQLDDTAIPVRQKQWNMEGVSIGYADPLTATLQEGVVTPLFEQQLPDIQALLRSIGEQKDMSFVTTDRQSVINR